MPSFLTQMVNQLRVQSYEKSGTKQRKVRLFSEKVGDEYLHAYQDKDNTSKKFWFDPTGDGFAEATSQVITHNAEKKRHKANNQQGHGELREFRKARAGERDAHGQRIDARGNGQ